MRRSNNGRRRRGRRRRRITSTDGRGGFGRGGGDVVGSFMYGQEISTRLRPVRVHRGQLGIAFSCLFRNLLGRGHEKYVVGEEGGWGGWNISTPVPLWPEANVHARNRIPELLAINHGARVRTEGGEGRGGGEEEKKERYIQGGGILVSGKKKDN